MPCHHATVEQKNGVLEFGELEYYKKWYLPIYFRNSVLLLKSSKKGGIGPFWPQTNNKIQPSNLLAHNKNSILVSVK